MKVWFESLKGRDESEDLSVEGRIMLNCTSSKQGGRVWIGFIWLRTGTGGWLL
jgi:hypothetical protein